jgi:hypothetical protein
MSDFCDFVPDDPSCQTAPEPEKPEPTNGGGDGPKPDIAGDDKPEDDMDMMKDEKMMDHDDKEMTWEKFDEMAGEYFHPMEANIAYFTVAAGMAAEIALHSFVWHEDNASTLSQAASGSGNTDYYDLMHMVHTYGGLAVWGTAAFTQLLATFGIMVGINMMVWGMLVPTGGMLLELGLAVLGFLAYNQFFEQYEANNSTAYAYMATMEREMAQHTASHVAGAFEIYHAMPSWLWGAYMASSDEDKAKWRSDKEFLMMLKLTPEMVEDWDMDGEKMDKMEMDGEKKPMDSLMIKPTSLRTSIHL